MPDLRRSAERGCADAPARPGRAPGGDAAVTGRRPYLHLVRHGQSTWNAAGLLQGRTAHVPLSVRGLTQAMEAAEVLRAAPVEAVYSSDQLRCMQTAELVAARHHLVVRPVAALREQCHGVWEGGSARVLGPLMAAAPADWAPPGGETARAVLLRAAAFLDSLPPATSDVVVVSHGETICALLAAVAGLAAENRPRALPGNGEVRSVGLPAPARAAGPAVAGTPAR